MALSVVTLAVVAGCTGGADVNHQDATRQSAYLVATSEVGDDPRLLELTLAHGADVAALDSYDGTGLIRAAHRGHGRVVDRDGRTPLDHARSKGQTEVLHLLEQPR